MDGKKRQTKAKAKVGENECRGVLLDGGGHLSSLFFTDNCGDCIGVSSFFCTFTSGHRAGGAGGAGAF
jgi:hypothetical protein